MSRRGWDRSSIPGWWSWEIARGWSRLSGSCSPQGSRKEDKLSKQKMRNRSGRGRRRSGNCRKMSEYTCLRGRTSSKFCRIGRNPNRRQSRRSSVASSKETGRPNNRQQKDNCCSDPPDKSRAPPAPPAPATSPQYRSPLN